jgi:hypothetical protein
MTVLLGLVVLAVIVTIGGVLTLSLTALALAACLWALVWQVWRLAYWLAERRFRARPLPARRRRD